MSAKDCQYECIWYGMAPHEHIKEKGIIITRGLQKNKWPDNFTPDAGGHQGMWKCPDYDMCTKDEKIIIDD